MPQKGPFIRRLTASTCTGSLSSLKFNAVWGYVVHSGSERYYMHAERDLAAKTYKLCVLHLHLGPSSPLRCTLKARGHSHERISASPLRSALDDSVASLLDSDDCLCFSERTAMLMSTGSGDAAVNELSLEIELSVDSLSVKPTEKKPRAATGRATGAAQVTIACPRSGCGQLLCVPRGHPKFGCPRCMGIFNTATHEYCGDLPEEGQPPQPRPVAPPMRGSGR